jgi:hypothetical protein
MQRYLFVSILFLLFLAAPVFAQVDNAGNLNFNVEGRAAINQNDMAGARDEAISDALLNGVLSAAAQILSLNVNDKRLESVRSAINQQQDKYIKNYKIIAERNQAELYFININVTVALPVLSSDLNKIGIARSTLKGISSAIVSLNIKGLIKYSDFSYLREFLKNKTRIVRNIYLRSFEWQQADLDIEILGAAQALADEMATTGLYILDTRQINDNQITVTLLQRGRE